MESEKNGAIQASDEQKEEQFILVLDPNDNDPVEILLSDNGTLALSALEHAFPGAYGLKYKNPATGGKRVVLFDEKEKVFLAPSGGWSGPLFEVIFQQKTAAKTTKEAVRTSPVQSFKKKVVLNTVGEERSTKIGKEPEEDNKIFDGFKDSDKTINEAEGVKSEEKEQHKEEVFAKSSERTGNFELPALVAEKTPSDLIVFGLPFDLDDWALREYFEQFGAVEYEEIKRKNEESRGFAFVRMMNYVDQVRALSVATHFIGGRECTLRVSAPDKGKDGFLENIGDNVRLYVGGLGGDVGRERLREFILEHLFRFDKRSAILELFYPIPFRFFAFISVSSGGAARELLRQRDFFIDGHHFSVTLAVPKKGEETPGVPAPVPHPAANALRQQQIPGAGWKQRSVPPVPPQHGPPIPPRGPPIDWAPSAGESRRWIEGGIAPIPPPPKPQYKSGYVVGTGDYPPAPPVRRGDGFGPSLYGHPPPQRAYEKDYPPSHKGGVYFPPSNGPPLASYQSYDYDQASYPMDGSGIGYKRRAPSPSPYDREEMMRPGPYGGGHPYPKSGRRENYDSWVGDHRGVGNGGSVVRPGSGGGASSSYADISPTEAEAVLNKLPNDAVGTALRMLQSIMAQKQKEQQQGGGGGGGNNGNIPSEGGGGSHSRM